MAREKIQPRLNPVTHAYLKDLAVTGLYGSTPTEVAKRLIEQGVLDAITKGHIKR